jgi:hypothetical protein
VDYVALNMPWLAAAAAAAVVVVVACNYQAVRENCNGWRRTPITSAYGGVRQLSRAKPG